MEFDVTDDSMKNDTQALASICLLVCSGICHANVDSEPFIFISTVFFGIFKTQDSRKIKVERKAAGRERETCVIWHHWIDSFCQRLQSFYNCSQIHAYGSRCEEKHYVPSHKLDAVISLSSMADVHGLLSLKKTKKNANLNSIYRNAMHKYVCFSPNAKYI